MQIMRSFHADYEVFQGFFPMLELNGFTAFNQADRSTGALGELDGADVLNFGAEDRDTTITFGGGFRYRFTDNLLIGLGGLALLFIGVFVGRKTGYAY